MGLEISGMHSADTVTCKSMKKRAESPRKAGGVKGGCPSRKAHTRCLGVRDKEASGSSERPLSRGRTRSRSPRYSSSWPPRMATQDPCAREPGAQSVQGSEAKSGLKAVSILQGGESFHAMPRHVRCLFPSLKRRRCQGKDPAPLLVVPPRPCLKHSLSQDDAP